MVDVVECTQQPTPYDHPLNPNVKLWDLPGVNTPNFPKEKYLTAINFDTYDFFIIISCTRFSNNDKWFALEVRKRKKSFYFARSKIDIDVFNDSKNYPNQHTREKVLTKIRSYCKESLIAGGIIDTPVYLICDDQRIYDFAELEVRLLSELPKIKREAALLTLQNTSEPFIKERTKQLLKRAQKVAIISGVAGALPIPGFSFGVDVAIIKGELELYKKAYGLDTDSLRKASESANIPEVTLVNAISHNAWFNCSVVELLRQSELLGVAALKEVMKVVPLLGSIFGGATSFGLVLVNLDSCISSMEEAALSLIEAVFKETYPENM